MSQPGTETRGAGQGHNLVLVIEHEPAVAELARRYLEREGLKVRVASSPAEAAAAFRAQPPAVVVLDLTMPGLSAAAIRRGIAARDRAGLPALICLEGSGGLRPRHLGVTADARGRCIRRPFSPRLLAARVRSAMPPAPAMPPATDGSLTSRAGGAPGVTHTLGNLVLDAATRTVTASGTHVAVTDTEFALLAFLAGNAGRVFTRQQLLSAVWGTAATAGTRTVDVYVAQLRAKLGEGSPIRTVRGVGYAAEHPL